MPATALPSSRDGRLNLEQQRKRAKELLRQLKAQATGSDLPTLSDAQWQIAKQLGFSSWPKLKAHVDAIDFAARHPDFGHRDEPATQHWRCGNDIAHSLKLAGFKGRLQVLADPLCMGPVRDLPVAEYLAERSQFISQSFGLPLADMQRRAREEHAGLEALQEGTPVVLWCEADAYDQLFLIRVLATLPPHADHVELIQVDRIPGVDRFIGIGQLAPDVLAWLWPQRRQVTPAALALARRAWAAYCSDSPQALAEIAHGVHPELPLLAPALLRQLQELPGLSDGLSLTERLTLQCLQESPQATGGQVFAELMSRREPLPYLGDMMFRAILRPLIDAPMPLLVERELDLDWPKRPLRLTELGEQVLKGETYWLDHRAPLRWVGGVCLRAGEGHWALDEGLGVVWRR
jgi:hypothetical protein